MAIANTIKKKNRYMYILTAPVSSLSVDILPLSKLKQTHKVSLPPQSCLRHCADLFPQRMWYVLLGDQSETFYSMINIVSVLP